MSIAAISGNNSTQYTSSASQVSSSSNSSSVSSSSSSYRADDGVTLSEQASALAPESGSVVDAEKDGILDEGLIGDDDGTVSGDLEDLKAKLAKEQKCSVDDIIVISGTSADDSISISSQGDGSVTVNINGEKTTYTADEARRLIIDGGAGNDNITASMFEDVGLNIFGGDGDDTIRGGSGNDLIYGGQGNDTIDGGKGNDRIVDHWGNNTLRGGKGDDYLEGGEGNDYIDGGDGYDVLYGLDGDDTLLGGNGNDYIDGGRGNDNLNGGRGDDNVIGGQGNDRLSGGTGDDLLVGGKGSDTIDGGKGSDKVISSGSEDIITSDDDDAATQTIKPMDIPSNFVVMGDEYEIQRLESDLDFLGNTEQGQMMFQELAASGHEVGFKTTNGGSYCTSWSGINGDPNVGSDSVVNVNTSKISLGGYYGDFANRAPVVSMYHEMCHSYNAAYGTLDSNWYDSQTGAPTAEGTGTKGCEWQAVGMANPNVSNNHEYLTENGMRELLGYNERTRY